MERKLKSTEFLSVLEKWDKENSRNNKEYGKSQLRETTSPKNFAFEKEKCFRSFECRTNQKKSTQKAELCNPEATNLKANSKVESNNSSAVKHLKYLAEKNVYPFTSPYLYRAIETKDLDALSTIFLQLGGECQKLKQSLDNSHSCLEEFEKTAIIEDVGNGLDTNLHNNDAKREEGLWLVSPRDELLNSKGNLADPNTDDMASFCLNLEKSLNLDLTTASEDNNFSRSLNISFTNSRSDSRHHRKQISDTEEKNSYDRKDSNSLSKTQANKGTSVFQRLYKKRDRRASTKRALQDQHISYADVMHTWVSSLRSDNPP